MRIDDLSADHDLSKFLSKASFADHDHIISSAWLEHGAFVGWLVESLAPRCYVELGTEGGFSYFAVCQTVAEFGLGTACYAIDTWKGEEHSGASPEAVFDLVSAKNERYRGFSTLIRSPFSEALPYFPDRSVDLLHVDGRHFYQDVKSDFESWLPKLTADAIVLFHDINVRTQGFGVWKYFEEMKLKYKTFAFFHGHGLGVLAVGQTTGRLSQLFDANAAEAEAVRFCYARLGQVDRLKSKISTHLQASAPLQAELAKLRERYAAARSELMLNRETNALQRAELMREFEQVTAGRDALERQHSSLCQQHDRLLKDQEKLAREASCSFIQRTRAFFSRRAPERAEAYDNEGQAVRDTQLFDETYYARAYASDLTDGVDPAAHFARIGWQKGNRPNRYFDPSFYLAHSDDVAAANFNPLLHYAEHGWTEGRRPSAEFDAAFYLRAYPDVEAAKINPLLHFLSHGRAEGRLPIPGGETLEAEVLAPTVRSVLRDQYVSLQPIPLFPSPDSTPTLTILTDSLAADSLFGGVGTAIVVGTLLAQRLGMRIRLATRTVAPDASAFGLVLKAHGIDWKGATEFVQSPLQDAKPLPFGSADIMFTTSWWTTRSALGSISPQQIVYLLQEDERMFYPFGDDRLRCSELLSDRNVKTLVNTQLLYDHLADGPDRIEAFRERSAWFNPAFPTFPRPASLAKTPGKLKLFFYARPGHPRNLYWRGLELLDACLLEGILSPDEWEFHFVGHAGKPVPELFGGAQAIVAPKMSWSDYAAMAATMDLALCLMHTPHPSYPPLDLAAVGAAVVTNECGLKKDLSKYSRNIVIAPPDLDSLKRAMHSAVMIARDRDLRLQNCETDDIPRDWASTLEPMFKKMFSSKP